MKEAAQYAESTQILMNVSEFTDVSRATDTLISASQAFGYTAETSMEVVDLLNTIGNNYAISTADLAQSLTKSSASLVAAGGDLAEAAALTATANKIVQDADSVGTALKTTSLRLRGTDVKVLEEEGVDTDGAVASKSKLQGKVKALSGVDILTETGEYKSTYEILSQIADVWATMNDMDQAALLELISGKRNSSVIAAILQNPEELKEAFADANDASGSAWKENEKYLDSIQGKIDQFTNAVQTLWSNILDDDLVKNLVSWVTKIIKSLDTVEGQILTVVKAVALLMAYKKVNPLDWIAKFVGIANSIKTDGLKNYIRSLFQVSAAQKTVTADTLVGTIVQEQSDLVKQQQIISTMGLAGATGTLTAAQKLQAAQELVTLFNGKMISEDLATRMAAMLGYKFSVDATNGATVALDTTTKSFMATNPVGWILLMVSAVVALVTWITSWSSTTEKLQEKLDDLNSEISDIESELDSLNSELETTQDRMEELLSKDSLSFVEEEELKNLQLQNELLEKKIKLQELLLNNKIKETNKTSEELINASWNGTNADKEYAIVSDGTGLLIEEDSFWHSGKSGKEALDDSINSYIATKQESTNTDDLYLSVLEAMDANNGKLDDALISKVEKQLGRSDGWFDEQFGNVIVDGVINDDASAKSVAEHVKSTLEDRRKSNDATLRRQEQGIEMVLGDLLGQIPENYQYGTSEIIDQAFDELTAYQLKYENAQGTASKSGIINTIFGVGASEELQELEKDLQEIASSEDSVATKTQKAQSLIQKAYESTDDGYKRLKNSIDIVDISVDELAKSFIATSQAADIGTLGGVFQVFADGEGIFKSAFTNLQLGIDEAGETITWNNLFKDVDGEKIADNLKIAAILEGADESVRDQFTKLVEAVENGTMSVNEALANWEMAGIDKAVEALNNEFESLNNEMFPDAADEISGLIDTVNELKAAFESVASSMDLLHEAQTQFNNSGRVSVKTALEIMSTTDEWDKVLTITEDSITLADNAEQALIQTQLDAIATQSKRSAELAKTKYEAALAAQQARKLSDAEQNVAAVQNGANAVTHQRANEMGGLETQTYSTAISELDYADNDDVVQTAESVKSKAIGLVSASIIGLDAAIQAFTSASFGNKLSSATEAWSAAYGEARSAVMADSNSYTTTVSQLKKDYENKRDIANVAANADKYGEFKNNYDFDKTPGDKYDDSSAEDAFQKEMDYWDNRIAANQARYEQLQNEIDLLETKGQKADASYYQEQAELEAQRLELLNGKKAAAQSYLDTLTEGSEEWWEVANILNDLESDIDDVTASLVDLQDAIGEIDTYKFEEFNTRLDNLVSKLGTIRDLIAPDGEEGWFDDEGNWTEDGVAVLGSYVQELELYKQGLEETKDELEQYNKAYAGNEAYYAKLGIHSEQEYYDKVEELTDNQYNLAESINDTEQSIVDMYESSIDAVEEYIETLIDGYNDYIDSVKDALDAERDLYEFKKNVQKQTKDIAELERRIASLSGSTNKSEIAERRKLEAQLYEARESLNDTYYDHAKDAQSEALDAEASAYEETMNKFIEELRLGLETATANMDEFLMSVTGMVTLNADTVLQKYQETELPLGDAITNPWEAAKTAVGDYSGDALDLMNQWAQNGFFTTTPEKIKGSLTSPWTAGQTAVGAFKTEVGTQMKQVVSNIASNVKTASGELSKLYQQIKDTEKQITNANLTTGGDGDNSDTPGGNTDPPPPKMHASGKNSSHIRIGKKTDALAKNKKTVNGVEFYLWSDGYYYPMSAFRVVTQDVDERGKKSSVFGFPAGTTRYKYYARGTAGTTRDQWAMTDERQFGDELVLVPGKDGNLSFMRKGTGVVPADMTQKLWELAQIPTSDLMSKNITAIVPDITKTDIKNEFSFDSLVHVDHCDQNTLKDLEKMVDNKINDFSKQMNYSIKKFAR